MNSSDKTPEKHSSDPYADLAKPGEQSTTTEAIPAATVVLLRDSDTGIETLMLRKNKDIRFGGMWVFPGGRIDADDYSASGDKTEAARFAAARETHEEAGIHTDPEDFIWFSRWTPPPISDKRFTTWFFAARVPEHKEIIIDGGEIHDHQWIKPQDAITRHGERSLNFVPPTWVTLHYLAKYTCVEDLLKTFASRSPKIYETHLGETEDGERVAIWHGDAGYDAWDATIKGDRHRLTMAKDGFTFENSFED